MKLIAVLCTFFSLSVGTVYADLYQWTDAQGVIHVVDDEGAIPEAYRSKFKTYRAAKPTNVASTLLSPSRIYPAKSQGAFAQKLALDLGLIKNAREDALGPLGAVGVQPAGGWSLSDPLTPEVHAEVIAAARRAAESRRIPLSADGAEAIVQQVGEEFLPPPAVANLSQPPVNEEMLTDQGQEVIIEQQSPQVIEVIREPVYVPTPVIINSPRWRGPGGGWHGRHPSPPPNNPPPRQPPTFAAPAPTHMPFGASHMPFGASHMPFGAGQAPSGANR